MSTSTKAAERLNRAIPWQPGDVLAFAGRGFESRVIALKTCSWRQLWDGHWISHVGIVGSYAQYGFHPKPVLFESTTLTDLPCCITGNVVRGVQAHWIDQRIASYNGAVWRFAIKEPLSAINDYLLSAWLHDRLGRPYDSDRCVLAGTHWLKRQLENPQAEEKFFCSELVAASLLNIGVIPYKTTHAHWWTPAGWCRWATGSGQYRGWERVK